MENLRKFFTTFVYCVAGITISSAVFITILLRERLIPITFIWEIIIMSLACTLGNFIYFSKIELTKKQMKARMIYHYLYINLVVFSGAYLWQWMTPGLIKEFLLMFLLIAIVYIAIMIASFRQEERMAEHINQYLRKHYPSDEEDDL